MIPDLNGYHIPDIAVLESDTLAVLLAKVVPRTSAHFISERDPLRER
jgi:hypothetical protein